MRRRIGWFALVLGLAAALGILPLYAQIRRDPRGPGQVEQGQPRNAQEARRVGVRPTDPSEVDWRTAGPVEILADSSRAARAWEQQLVQMERAGELAPRKLQEDTQIAGRQHARLDQYYQGVPVFGGDIVRQTAGQRTVSVFGHLYSGISIAVTPTLTADHAVAVFEHEIGQSASSSVQKRLMILPKDDGTFALVYRVTQFTGTELPVLFINAMTGAVERRYDNLQTQSPVIGEGQGVLGDRKKLSVALFDNSFVASDEMRPPALLTLDLKGNYSRALSILDWLSPSWSDVAASADNGNWGDPAVVDAHGYLGWIYDYYFKRFGRRGLDNNNAPIRAIVHAVRREDSPRVTRDVYSLFLTNAFWCGSCGSDGRGYMVFGDGNRPGYYDAASGQRFNFLSGSLDIAAHELTHAVTTYTSDLIYQNEPGALNEGFSDIMATSAEFFFQQAGSGSMTADYIIGEDTVTSATSWAPTGLRSLADPLAYGDPDHYAIRYRGVSDDGGVHTNGLIAGHAFYLAVEGGRNRTSGLSVQGVGGANREQIEKIFYRAFAYYLPSNATFSTARAATIRAAQDLYGAGSAAERAVTQAWTAVGVF